jgi:hypothetical protein
LRLRTFFCRRGKNDSIGALSPHAPVRPIDPIRPWSLRVRTKAFERNWLPLSECAMVPTGPRRAMALRSAETASAAFIRECME